MDNINSDNILSISSNACVHWLSIIEEVAQEETNSSKSLGKWQCEGASEENGLILYSATSILICIHHFLKISWGMNCIVS